ncbi:MAG: NAD(P)-dependent oxidoreductase [Ilumatobacteraceae bacterium]
MTRIAVGPSSAPNWLRDAVRAGGCEVVDYAQAQGLVWGDPRGADALGEVLREHQHLAWVQLPFAGIENFVVHLDDERIWTSGKGVYAEPVAELCMAFLLGGLRHVIGYSRVREWTVDHGRYLLGGNIVIVGGGGITASLVRMLQGFNTHITVVRRHDTPLPGVQRVVTQAHLHEVLPAADAVVLACALTPETMGLIGARELQLMKHDAWLVNVGRGRLVVTDDLVVALRDQRIGGAALDVTDPEPLPSQHPLWTFDNCLVTPHIGNTRAMAVPLLSERVATNCRLFAAGQPLVGVVDVRLGY